MLLHAPAKLNLCLYLGPRREDGLHELCSLFEPLALADLIEVSEAEARRGGLPRGRGREPGGAGAGGAARARLGAAAAADRDREAGAGRRRARRRQRRRRGGPAARRRRGRRAAASWPPQLGADVPSQLRPALALVRGAGERVEPLPEPAPHAAVLLPGRGRAQHRRGLRRGRPARARPRAGGAGGAGGAAARGGRRRRLAARLRRAARQRPRAAPPARCGPTIGDALEELREAGAPRWRCSAAPARPRSGSSPTSPPPAPPPRRSTATTRSSATAGEAAP